MQRATSGTAVWRRTAIALTIVLAPWAAACADDDDAVATATSCDESAGSRDAREADPDDPGSFTIVDIRHDVVEAGCERVVVDLDPDDEADELAYSVSYRRGPVAGPSGTIDVDGESILELVLHQASTRGRDLDVPEPAGNSEIVVDIVPLPEVPGGSVWAFGVAEQAPFVVSVERGSPSQLIVTLTGSAT